MMPKTAFVMGKKIRKSVVYSNFPRPESFRRILSVIFGTATHLFLHFGVNFPLTYKMIPDYAPTIKKKCLITHNRGNAHIRLGKFKEALKDFDRGVALDPKNPKAHYDREVAYDRLKNYPRSMYNLKIAAKLGHKGAQNILKSKGITW